MANLLASSSNSSGNNNSPFEIFINHRGPDTKLSIAAHLYSRLTQHGLRVFLDKEEMEKGDFLTSQIAAAIRDASLQIAIFSPGYADSEWCLNELLLMLESNKSGRSAIIPIFYGVQPVDLRWTLGKDGVYAKALAELQEKKTTDPQTHQEKPRYDSDIIEKWRNALSSVSLICGFDLQAYNNGGEWRLVDDVVQRVLEKIEKPQLYVSKYPTGLDQKVKEFEELLHQQNGGTKVIGIVGLRGVGKTTLSKEIFNSLRSNYKQSCFLFDIRKKSRNSLHSLQSMLIKDLTGSNVQISSTDEGQEKLRRYLSSSQALIILDDVDHIKQLDALLLPAKAVLHTSSLILVTSRNKDVLISSDIPESSIYSLKGLNPQHSQELFCSHAFGQPQPVVGFDKVVEKFLGACHGLPLSLEVLGALLHRKKDLNLWEVQSKILVDIQSTLKISYDSLDEGEAESPHRLWSLTDNILHDLPEIFTALRINMVETSVDNRAELGNHFPGMRGLQLIRAEGDCLDESIFGILRSRHLIWFRWDRCPFSCLRRWIPMEHIRVLHVAGSTTLKALWEDHNLQVSFGNLTELQHINLSACYNLERLPESFGEFKNLQHINLSACNNLERLPESFGELKNLQHINLSQCYELERLPDSFGELKSLQHINLFQCRELERLPDSFGELKSLQHINLSSCNKLKRLPDSFGVLTNLQHVNLSRCSNLEVLPVSFGGLTNLQHVNLSRCSNLGMLPVSFGGLTNLQHVNLSRCSNLEMLPDSFGGLTNLQHVNLCECSSLHKFPNSLKSLKNLRYINLSKYSNLVMLPYSFGNLKSLHHINLSGCSNLQMLPNSLENMQNLKHIDLSRCSKLQMLPNFFGNLSNLQHIDLSWCSNLKMLPNTFGNLTRLQHVDLSRCSSLPILPKSFGNLIQLKHLCLRKCYDLTISSETLGKIRTLEWLEISGCYRIEVLPPQVAHQRFLREMYLFCPFLKELPSDMEELCNLKTLHLASSCLDLLEIETLVSLEDLRTRECVKLKRIQGLSQLTKLRRLDVAKCSELEQLEGVESLRSLVKLDASECPNLQWSTEVMEQLREQLKESLITH